MIIRYIDFIPKVGSHKLVYNKYNNFLIIN